MFPGKAHIIFVFFSGSLKQHCSVAWGLQGRGGWSLEATADSKVFVFSLLISGGLKVKSKPLMKLQDITRVEW